jgi:hypothetical protein
MPSFGEAILCILCPCYYLFRRRQKSHAHSPHVAVPEHTAVDLESGHHGGYSEEYSYSHKPAHTVYDGPYLEAPASMEHSAQPVNEWRVNIASDTPRADVTRPVRAGGR